MTDVDCVSLLGRPGAPAPYDARYILRPETVESLFIAYRLSGDEKYRRYGWKIFQAIETHCKIESGGYASIINVDQVPVVHEDKMETFLMVRTELCICSGRDIVLVVLTSSAERDAEVPLPVVRRRLGPSAYKYVLSVFYASVAHA